ncbi:leucine zipper putative tumor suppressor 1 [Alligator mississippiensis]|uniref:Leucine zipper putative tumor suppressor 1 n=1 Tax=Alligator mississippiensis TaxID=8496 RepID=A0A151NBI3_ALLMI|nr:leucine zipper putative tumor suppressor 1 [Alligator mississippiensis]XP_019347105.1 leucine zipper putative tumor suppressor 1 [Alligator mississippiensis]XP_019347106.1 leucine zipper putative tumor suppressor 1 [Alligator mississippiensis]XP_059586680.1 leucine zipper putative tumor suppressor 1 [Alligator mississippiensis]KYO34176.1 leucine zipper putative tumor suppressor 1 [Alligator mississippiensis]
MGSVSSLISGHSFHSKHCRASQYKLRKSSHLKKLNRYSDGLLRFGFSQDSGHNKSSSKGNKNEDFFYIKVSQKAHATHRTDYTSLSSGDQAGATGMDYGSHTPQKLMPFSNQLELGAEKSASRPTAFKPVIPRSGAILHSSPENGSHISQQLHPPEKTKDQELKPTLCSGALSDSGRNSMSSLPTHSTSSSYQLDPLVTPVGPISRFGGSAHNITQCSIIQDSNMMSLKAMSFSDSGNKIINPGKAAHHASEKTSCIRSPISTDESTIQELEQKLLEREGELQELQSSFEEKEVTSCQVYEEKQRRCKEEMDGLKQKCNSKLKQTNQKTQRTQQVLHLQVFQLQQEKQQLRDELEKLMKEQNLLETKLRSYEKEKTNFAPALEETQWEVCQKSGEISLLKQQLKESQTDLNAKTSEILSLKAQLKDVRGKMDGVEMKTQNMEDSLHTKTMELEVCENELQRKKNESELLREKVNLLEQEIVDLRTELTILKEQWNEGRDGAAPVNPASWKMEDVQALQGDLERLKAELKAERDNNEQMTSSFQHERQVWKEEKEKVIQYQKQLQQSYLHMYKRNQNLEKMLQQLAAGEDGKEPIDLDIHGTDVPYEDIIATEI